MSTKNCAQPSGQQTLDRSFASYLMGFAGIFCFNAYLFILFFNGFAFHLDLGAVKLPAVLFTALMAAVLLPIVRFKHYLFEGHSRILALKATGFICTCIAPIGLLFPYIWLPCAALIGIGIISLGFLWSLYMCRFTHQSVATLLSISSILSALLSALLLLRIESPPPQPYRRL